jgi:hypothetical protein
MARPIKKSILRVLYIHPQTGGQHLITKQKGSRAYQCQGQGTTVFRLVASTTLAENQAYMIANDSYGNTYFVTKLTAHKATLVQKDQNEAPPFQFASNTAVAWDKFRSAVEGLTVQIQNDD